ncbi:hypothetical protein DPMN_122503 [Dreissena polymorpha]|uniref:Secreted protein n=1 Tax=Dreissena polymorpha TaxID=45954 RepID=A0A9D4GSM4_DREPO|nr:hypothetical protein DPMN_122503 [Dreissena polymorpha]
MVVPCVAILIAGLAPVSSSSLHTTSIMETGNGVHSRCFSGPRPILLGIMQSWCLHFLSVDLSKSWRRPSPLQESAVGNTKCAVLPMEPPFQLTT